MTDAAKPKADGATLPYYHTNTPRWRKALGDIREGLAMAPLWVPITLKEIFGQFRRFALGTLWIPIGMIMLVLSLGYVYSYLMGYEFGEYSLYLFGGLIHWQLIQESVTRSMSLFTKRRSDIENVKVPYSYIIFKLIFESFINYLIVVPVLFIYMAIIGAVPSMNMLWLFAALPIYVLTMFSVMLFFALVTMRYRDIEAPVANIMRIAFLLTPIIWRVDPARGPLGGRALFVQYNPFYHFIEIARAPLMGTPPTLLNWIVTIGVMIAFLVMSLVIFIYSRHRIPYWI